LSVLEEGTLFLPSFESNNQSVKVHPDFRMIFTSNPVEYAGVHKTQAALEDRMVTIQLGEMDRETEIAVTIARSGIDHKRARAIGDFVRGFRDTLTNRASCSVRTCIKIAKVFALTGTSSTSQIPVEDILLDILFSELWHGEVNGADIKQKVKSTLDRYSLQKV
jgi:gas vesicle protein GvpN